MTISPTPPSPDPHPSIKHRDGIALALSRFLGTTNSVAIACLMPMLEHMSRTPLRGESTRQPVSSSRAHPETTLRRLGMSMEKLHNEFAQLKRFDGDQARLDDAVLFAMVPPPYWIIIDQLIDDGPSVTARRLDVSIHRQAEQLVPPTTARPEGGLISKGTLSKRVQAVRRFLSCLAVLNTRIPELGLDGWVQIPKIDLDDLPNPEEVTVTTAPDLRLLRTTLADLDSRIESALKRPPDEQIEAIQQHPNPARLSIFRLLQRRVELSLLCTVGMRVGALVRLKVQDIEPTRQRAGGGAGPAIALRPRKTVKRHAVRHKPIPQGLYQWHDPLKSVRPL